MKKIFILFTTIALFSCEDVIDLEVKEGKEQLVVDAWLTDEVILQNIKLTISQPYFNQDTPQPALGAEVYLIKHDSTTYKFDDLNKDGNYSFHPRRRVLEQDKPVALYIKYNGEEYYATSELKRVPHIDSLKYQKLNLPVKPDDGPQNGFLAQFYANDYPGIGDTYLIRSYKNDILRAKPSDLGLAYDAGFSPGTKTDGMLFLQPVRMSINSTLFEDGDKVTVELFSIPNAAYYYLSQLKTETSNGGIFGTPPSNVPTNIFNRNPNSQEKAVGAFFVSKVTRFSAFIDKDSALPED